MSAMDFTFLLGLRNSDLKLNEFLQQFGRKPRFDIDQTQIAYLQYKNRDFVSISGNRRQLRKVKRSPERPGLG
jgi:hypothetical protein